MALLLALALHGAVAHSESAEQHRAQAALGPAAHALGAAVDHNDVVARRALAHDAHVDHLRAQDPRHAKTLKYGNNHATRGAHDNARGIGAGRWGGYLSSAGARGPAIRGQPAAWRVIQASLLDQGSAAQRGGRNAQPERPVPPAELQAAHRQLFGADLQHPLLGHARAASSPLPIVASLARAVDHAMDWGGGSFGDGVLEEVELAGYMNRAARLRILLHLQATVSAHTQRRAADDVAHIAALKRADGGKAGGLTLSGAEHMCQHRDPLLPGPVPRAFAFADVDNDGLLSVEEYLLFDFGMTSKQLRDEQGFEDAEGWVGAVAEMATAGARMVMEAVDEDGDGRLTQEEMVARYEHFGLPAGARGSGARSNVVRGEL